MVAGIIAVIENPALTLEELMERIPGPDFPTAGFIYGTEGILSAYRTGRGIIQMRARARVEKQKKSERESIIVTEIPYQVNKSRLIEKIAELVREKKIEGISDLRDESDRDGMRIVIELKKDENPQVLLNQLYKHTQMQSSFGIIMLAIVNNRPKVLTLKEVIRHFIDHRREIVTRRTVFELKKAEARAHILLGLKIALDWLDAVIAADGGAFRFGGRCGGEPAALPLRAAGAGYPRDAAPSADRAGAGQDHPGVRGDPPHYRPA